MRQVLQAAMAKHIAPATLLAAALIVGCSGGSSTAGIEGTGDIMAAKGTVTAFGSIWVNGVRFDTTDAVVNVDDQLVSEDAILPGMVVNIEATIDAAGLAHARTVSADVLLQGPVTQLNPTALPYYQLHVLGQTVVVPEEVVWAGVQQGELTVGLPVRISGLVRSDGTVLATRIDTIEAADTLEVEGIVAALDPMQLRLTVGSLQVDYAAAEFADGSSDQLALGQRISVRGRLASGDAEVLVASEIRVESNAPNKAKGTAVVWEGLIESYNPAGVFELNDLVVDATAAAVERGSVNQLGNGVRVSVAGRMNAEGVLVAESVKLLLPNETRFATVVEGVDATSQQVTLLSTTFSSDALTAFEDLSPGQNRRLGLADIAAGDTVEVFGRYISDKWVATRIRKLGSDQAESSFRGPVGEIISDTEFYVLGVLVNASEASGQELVAQLAPGDVVSVDGVRTGVQAVTATAITRAERSECPAPVANACGAKASPNSSANADNDGQANSDGNSATVP